MFGKLLALSNRCGLTLGISTRFRGTDLPYSKAVRRVSSRLMRVRWLLPLTAKHFLMGTDLIVVPTCNGRPLNARIVNQILCCVNNDTFKFTIQCSLLLVYGVDPPTHGLQW